MNELEGERLAERVRGHEELCGERWGLLLRLGAAAVTGLLSILIWFNLQLAELRTLSEVRDQRIAALQQTITEVRMDVKRLLTEKSLAEK